MTPHPPACMALSLTLLALWLAACASPAPVPTTAPAPTSAPGKSSAPEVAARPAASPSPSVKAADWERVVAEAKREGKVVVMGPSGADLAVAMAEGFQRRFPDISLEYSGLGGTAVINKIRTEQAAGFYQADLFVGGSSTAVVGLLPSGAFDPILPFLVGPEVDPSRWLGGKFDFSDAEDKYVLVFNTTLQPAGAYNPNLVSRQELTSWRDLLDPKWKGKIIMNDPRNVGGPGGGLTRYLYTNPELGKDYIRQLFTQEIVLGTDERQVVDGVARGSYPIALAASYTTALELKSRGLPLELITNDMLKEGTWTTSGVGAAAVYTRAPHPNAAKVYLDWLLSREGQAGTSKATGAASRRLDVPRDHLDSNVVPKEGVQYRDTYKAPALAITEEMTAFLESVVPR